MRGESAVDGLVKRKLLIFLFIEDARYKDFKGVIDLVFT